MNDIINFLKTRRSRSAKTFGELGPEAAELEEMLEIAARVPDHGALNPWRFIVLDKAFRKSLEPVIKDRGAALSIQPEKIENAVRQFTGSPVIVAVICSPKISEKVPEIEQILSTGAVCAQLVNIALAKGWGACWLTGFSAMDRVFVEKSLGLTPTEFVAGFVHIGEDHSTPSERPRPVLSDITEWKTL